MFMDGGTKMEKKKETSGRDYLGGFAPQFAALNDDVLFGEVWSREDQLSARDRSLITVSALMASGILDMSLKGHLIKAKENGITKDEIAEVITHLAFYTGWPKAWAAFALAQDIFAE
jgi:4-carboxymuconolactone decarboxylase